MKAKITRDEITQFGWLSLLAAFICLLNVLIDDYGKVRKTEQLKGLEQQRNLAREVEKPPGNMLTKPLAVDAENVSIPQGDVHIIEGGGVVSLPAPSQ